MRRFSLSILTVFVLACVGARAAPPRCVGAGELDDSPNQRYLRTLELLVDKRQAFSGDTLDLLAHSDVPVNPFTIEEHVLSPTAEHPFRRIFEGALAEGVDWPSLRKEIAAFALARKGEAARRDDVGKATAPIFHVGKPERGLLPEEVQGMRPSGVGKMQGPDGEVWLTFRSTSWDSMGKSSLVIFETKSKHRFEAPVGTIRATFGKGADGNVRVLIYRRDGRAHKEFAEIYDPKTSKRLASVDFDDHPVFASPVGSASERSRPIGNFGFIFSQILVGRDGSERIMTTWKDSPGNHVEPTIAANIVDLKTGRGTPITVPPGTYEVSLKNDAQDLFVYGWEGKKGTPRRLVVRSLADGKKYLDVPFAQTLGRPHQLTKFYESRTGDLYLAAREDRDGKQGLRFFDLTRKTDRYMELANCDDGFPGFIEGRDGKISVALAPTAKTIQIAHPFDGGTVDTIPLSHDIQSGEPVIHRLPDGRPFLVAQTWNHVDPTEPNKVFIYDFEGHTGDAHDVGRMGLRGMFGIVTTPEGHVKGLFDYQGRTDQHFSLATATLFGPVEGR